MNKKLSLAILALAVSTFVTGSAISAGLALIAAAFPDASELAIQMLISLPAVALVPSSIYAGVVASRVGKKKMAIIGSAIYLLGGVGAGFMTSINAMLAFRFLLGIGAGILLPLPLSLVADFYEGKQRALMTGYVTGMASLGGMVMTIFSGILAQIHWRLIFGVYGIMLPVLLMSIFWLEAPPKHEVKIKTCSNKNVYKVGLYLFVVTVFMFALPLFAASYITAMGLGGAIAASLVLVMPNVAGIMMGTFFLRIKSSFKVLTGPAGLLFLGLGFLLMSMSASLLMMVLGALVFGMGVGIINPINYLRLVNSVPADQAPFAVAIVNAIMSGGQFVAPLFYFVLRTTNLVSDVGSIYQFNGIFLLVLALLFGIKRHFIPDAEYVKSVLG